MDAGDVTNSVNPVQGLPPSKSKKKKTDKLSEDTQKVARSLLPSDPRKAGVFQLPKSQLKAEKPPTSSEEKEVEMPSEKKNTAAVHTVSADPRKAGVIRLPIGGFETPKISESPISKKKKTKESKKIQTESREPQSTKIDETEKKLKKTEERKDNKKEINEENKNSFTGIERNRPKFSMAANDSVRINLPTKKVTSLHDASANCFEDKEIVSIKGAVEKNKVINGKNVNVKITPDKKFIIPQQGMRACTAAATAMLIYDNQKEIKHKLERNLGNVEEMQNDLQLAGLEYTHQMLSEKSQNKLAELRDLINRGGPAIVDIYDPQVSSHVVVVDSVSDDLKTVELRDPVHGWQISVHGSAFNARLIGEVSVLQVEH